MSRSLPLTWREYLLRTRGRRFNVMAVVALLAVYEVGLFVLAEPRRNGADVILKHLLSYAGPHAVDAFHGFLLLLFVLAFAHHARRSRSLVRYFPPFIAECSAYAMLLSPAILFLANPGLARPHPNSLLLDVGAGVYEELLFRLLLLRGMVFLMGVDPYVAFAGDEEQSAESTLQLTWAVLIPVVVSSLAFAAYHHAGVGGDPWVWSLFSFRFIAGLLLAQLFFVRGLAVCVYTHAIYDILVHFSALI